MHCGACQTRLAPEARFCPACGERVSSQASPAPADSLKASLEAALGVGYPLLRLLGRGGMGAVYLARELSLDRLVAIKVLPPERGDRSGLQERFRREARTAAKLTHPNIVPLHSMGEAEGVMYFVMGYVRGESLAAKMRREEKLLPEEARRILAEVADALDYAHRQGVVHRDIKPDNILIDDESGRPMLADFGIAKARGARGTLTEEGGVIGTPSYMSPEQASGQDQIDGRSDIYSLGVMGYALVSGRLPFAGETPSAILMQHLTREPRPLAEVAPEAPSDIVAAVTRCLAKDAAARWPDGRSLRTALAFSGPGLEELPEALQRVAGWGVWLLVFFLSAVYGAWFGYLWDGHLGPFGVMVVRLLQVPLVAFPVFFYVQSLEARGRGLGWRQVLSAAFRQPRWWRWWYPEALRRPGDVWLRLPPSLRRARTVLGLTLTSGLVVPAVLVPFFSPRYLDDPQRGPLSLMGGIGWGVAALYVTLGIFMILSYSRAHRWLRGFGLSRWDADRVLDESALHGPFWTRPDIAALLLPPARPGEAAPPAPRWPQEYLQAILRIAQDLTGGAREPGAQAAAVARELVSKVDSLEAEVGELRHDVDSDELGRIDRRLESLGPEAPGEDRERRQIRELLSRQREVARSLAAHKERKAVQQARLVCLLEGLWSVLRTLQSMSTAGTQTPPAGMDQVRALCREIEAELRGDGGEAEDAGASEDVPTMPIPSDE
jgi:hypothetical protein